MEKTGEQEGLIVPELEENYQDALAELAAAISETVPQGSLSLDGKPPGQDWPVFIDEEMPGFNEQPLPYRGFLFHFSLQSDSGTWAHTVNSLEQSGVELANNQQLAEKVLTLFETLRALRGLPPLSNTTVNSIDIAFAVMPRFYLSTQTITFEAVKFVARVAAEGTDSWNNQMPETGISLSVFPKDSRILASNIFPRITQGVELDKHFIGLIQGERYVNSAQPLSGSPAQTIPGQFEPDQLFPYIEALTNGGQEFSYSAAVHPSLFNLRSFNM